MKKKISKEKKKQKTTKNMNLIINNKGITLIALVITIIVLLILAGVTIATLTGDNGILTQANKAKEKTEEASAEEKVKLEVAGSYGIDGKIDTNKLNKNLENVNGLTSGLPIVSLPATVVVDGNEIMIGISGNVGAITRIPIGIETTKPYLPGNDFTVVESNLDNGIVVTDGTNYWTWIEVPTDIYENTTYNGGIAPTGADDYDAIETILNNYTGTLVSRGSYADVWYDSNGRTADNEEVDLNDTEGCGLTYEEYNSLKNYMLSSIYQNGGFWIGQYEAGARSYPATKENDTRDLIVQRGAYPYNFIECSDAQRKSSRMKSGNYISSLMFGIQWDLVLKHLQVHGADTLELTGNSSGNWGNYSDINFEIDRGGYTTSPSTANSFTLLLEGETYLKSNTTVLLTTGATERNMKMNIYDLAGSVNEWTLEKSTDSSYSCVRRGGSFYADSSSTPVSNRNSNGTSASTYNGGFRPALY